MNVKDKVIVVTGGGNGIGREIVLALLEKGAMVAAVDLNESFLKETASLASDYENKLSLHTLDITNHEAVSALPEQVIKTHKKVDGLINVAGIIQPFIKVNELDFKKIEQVMNVNFYGTLYMVKAFLPHFLENEVAHIVNVSSMGGFVPVPGQTIYGASKAAVKLLTEGLRSELLETNVKVSVVFPGGVGTNITKNSDAMNKRLESASEGSTHKVLSPKEAAALIIKGMEKDKPRIVIGKDARFMDKLSRLMPIKAGNLIAKNMKDLLDE
jgi:short-subunit dehydrogenase